MAFCHLSLVCVCIFCHTRLRRPIPAMLARKTTLDSGNSLSRICPIPNNLNLQYGNRVHAETPP